MLVSLSRSRTSWAAYCDACLVGSPVVCDGPLFARAIAVERLRHLGWAHVPPAGLPGAGRQMAEQAWTGETYCFDCAARMERRRAG